MKLFILAGEASGDLHAGNLVKALSRHTSDLEVRAWGGEKLEDAGAQVLKHYKELAIIGFVEVLKKLPTIFKNFNNATKQVLEFQPDAVVLVDFSGFNLRWAKKLRKAGYKGKIFYYISPKLWVWNSKRVNKVNAYIDEMFVILPFEVDFYKEHGFDAVHYIGNPLMDEIASFQADDNFLDSHGIGEQPIVALLPGSRSGELKNMLPMMLDLAQEFPDYQFAIAGVNWLKEDYPKYIGKHKIPIIFDDTYNLLANARAAVVTSGTATLEAGLFGVPQLVCYRGNELSYRIAKQVVNVAHISLVNLIMNGPVLKEYIQSEMNLSNLTTELRALLADGPRRESMISDYAKLKERVAGPGASDRAAEIMARRL